MESWLYKVAIEGKVNSLLNLLNEDALILDKFIVGPCTDTPLHIAAMLGHVEFIHEILVRKPEMAGLLDSQGASPLHHASAKGYVHIVKELLQINPEACFVRDRYGRNPLHIAAAKGQVVVLKELMQIRPLAVFDRLENGDTILHLCVKNNKLEALKVLIVGVDYEFIKSKNNDGNTILHVAAANKQIEIIHFLISETAIEVNSLNQNGITAFDLLAQNRGPATSIETINLEPCITQIPSEHTLPRNEIQEPLDDSKPMIKYFKIKDDWIERKRSALMVVASLTATMAFQVGVNPPGGVWQDNSPGENGSASHTAGFSIMADNDPTLYSRFLASNTTGLVASLSIILLLVSGLPFKRKFFVFVLMVILWVAITSMAITYSISLFAFTPERERNEMYKVLRYAILAWVGLMLMLLVGHAIRIIVKGMRCLGRGLYAQRKEHKSVVANRS